MPGRNSYKATNSAVNFHLWNVISHVPLTKRWHPQVVHVLMHINLTWMQTLRGKLIKNNDSTGRIDFIRWISPIFNITCYLQVRLSSYIVWLHELRYNTQFPFFTPCHSLFISNLYLSLFVCQFNKKLKKINPFHAVIISDV